MISHHSGRSRPAPPTLRPHQHKAGNGIAGPLRSSGSHGHRPHARPLRFEPLEPRRVLALVTVTTLDDSVDLTDGQTSLREALFATNTVPGPDEIRFAPALFAAGPGTILLTRGELTITDSLTLTGPGAELLSIDASGNDPTPDQNNGDGSRVLLVSVPSASAFTTIEEMTLTGGDSSGSGGAISSNSLITVANVNLIENSASRGGAIYAAMYMTLRDSSVAQNQSIGVLGGGGGVYAASGATVLDSIFQRNSVIVGGNGGGLFVGATSFFNPGPSLIARSVFTENATIHDGGGIASTANLRIEGSLIASNQARMGGGMLGFLGALVRSTIVDNVAATNGGGVRTVASDRIHTVIEDATISRNGARDGGAGLTLFGSVSVRRSTITDNLVELDSGGTRGSGITGFATIDHTIVAGNFEGGGSTPSDVNLVFQTLTPLKYSLIGSYGGSQIAEAPLGAPDANGNLIGGPIHGVIDPLLAPLADNGGPTLPGGARLLTHALLPGSPALDAGDPSFVPGLAGAPEFDGRGAPFTRLAGPRVDIGAFEAQSAVGALTADFDFSGRTDGLDFLAWQRNFGLTTAATFRQGDATANAAVDTSDYQVWAARFGEQDTNAASPAIAATASNLLLPPPSPERGGAGGGVTEAPVSAALMSRRASERLTPTYAPAARGALAISEPRAYTPTVRAAAFDDLAHSSAPVDAEEIAESDSRDADVGVDAWDAALARL